MPRKNKDVYKESITVRFDKDVLALINEKAREQGVSKTNVVNFCCRRILGSDEMYYSELARFHAVELAKAQFMRDNVRESVVVQNRNI